MFDPTQEVIWALDELDREGIIHALEKIRRLYPYEWEMATLTPTQRKFHNPHIKRVVEGDKKDG